MTLRSLKSLSPLLALCFLFLFLTGINANSEPVQWEVNGHWYDAIDGSFTWIQAFFDARSRSYQDLPGHLATLTSQAENDFVWNTFEPGGYWLGGYQVRMARKVDRGWRWITHERWRFTNWKAGEPNDLDAVENGEENFLELDGGIGIEGEWNDVANSYEDGYVIEYEEMPDQALAPIKPKDIHLERKLTTTWAILKQSH